MVTVTEVGGDDPENDVDRVAVGVNENAAWVNAPGERMAASDRTSDAGWLTCDSIFLHTPGAWLIHPVMILLAKVLVDAIPRMTQDVSWTIINLGYMAVSCGHRSKVSTCNS